MKYEHIIWDFNGTLLDDVWTGIVSVNKLLEDRGLPKIASVEDYRRVFRFPIIEYYRSLGFDFDKEPYEVIAPQWVALYLENVKSAGLYEDASWALDRAEKAGMTQTLLSATELNMLKGQVRELGVEGYFDRIAGLDNIHAGSKLALARAWRQEYPFDRAIMIGDTDHDVDTARELGADCVLVCRGHQPKEYLQTLGVPVADSIREAFERYIFN